LDPPGGPAACDSKCARFGARPGAGRKLKVGAGGTLDLRGKYLWSHVGSDDAALAGSGDRAGLSSVDSRLVGAGAGRPLAPNGNVGRCFGPARGRESDGKSSAPARGLSLPEPKTGAPPASEKLASKSDRPETAPSASPWASGDAWADAGAGGLRDGGAGLPNHLSLGPAGRVRISLPGPPGGTDLPPRAPGRLKTPAPPG
jgi:hypothetical protein